MGRRQRGDKRSMMNKRETLEQNIALYLANELCLGSQRATLETATAAETTPLPEIAKDIVDIVFETLVIME